MAVEREQLGTHVGIKERRLVGRVEFLVVPFVDLVGRHGETHRWHGVGPECSRRRTRALLRCKELRTDLDAVQFRGRLGLDGLAVAKEETVDVAARLGRRNAVVDQMFVGVVRKEAAHINRRDSCGQAALRDERRHELSVQVLGEQVVLESLCVGQRAGRAAYDECHNVHRTALRKPVVVEDHA